MGFPVADRPGVGLDREYLALLHREPLVPVVLPGGHRALLVTRYSDVRAVLADQRFSRAAWGNGTLFAREADTLALAASDPPVHTRRRRAVRSWFTARRAELDRPLIEATAAALLAELAVAGPPADLVTGFATPFAYRVICSLLGVPAADVPMLAGWSTVLMSAGRFAQAEIDTARAAMRGYFGAQVAARRRSPGPDLLSELLGSGLREDEIVVFGLGLLMAGGETTSSHLAAGLLEVLSRTGLAGELRARPERIPAAVEELLRWVWFAGTGGHPHVVLADAAVAGRTLRRGQVVIPLTDAANRDPAAFDHADEFRPDRTPNPHLGFGYGRHMCLGAAHARIELVVAIGGLLRHFDDLRLLPGEPEWRSQMFVRAPLQVPVTWTAR